MLACIRGGCQDWVDRGVHVKMISGNGYRCSERLRYLNSILMTYGVVTCAQKFKTKHNNQYYMDICRDMSLVWNFCVESSIEVALLQLVFSHKPGSWQEACHIMSSHLTVRMADKLARSLKVAFKNNYPGSILSALLLCAKHTIVYTCAERRH